LKSIKRKVKNGVLLINKCLDLDLCILPPNREEDSLGFQEAKEVR